MWSSRGVQAFVKGYRPNPVDIFNRIVDGIKHFIIFDRSLADQRTMVEFIACWVLSTWFLDAFDVVGFLWITGERGSGKTNLLTVIAAMSYLGYVILSTGSFASLRDLADYGATLALMTPKTIQPKDKRSG